MYCLCCKPPKSNIEKGVITDTGAAGIINRRKTEHRPDILLTFIDIQYCTTSERQN